MEYKELDAWLKGMDLVEEVYSLTKRFPDEEKFGLINQMRRSAVSIVSNIAEGSSRNSDKEYLRFVHIAYASCAELETQLLIAERLNYIKNEHIPENIISLKKLINGLKRHINKRISENDKRKKSNE